MDAEAATGESLGTELQEEVHHVGPPDEVRRLAMLQSLLRRWTRALEGLEVREDYRGGGGRGGVVCYEVGEGICCEEGGVGVVTVSAHGLVYDALCLKIMRVHPRRHHTWIQGRMQARQRTLRCL